MVCEFICHPRILGYKKKLGFAGTITTGVARGTSCCAKVDWLRLMLRNLRAIGPSFAMLPAVGVSLPPVYRRDICVTSLREAERGDTFVISPTKVQRVSFEYFGSRGCYASRGQGSKLGIRTANWV